MNTDLTAFVGHLMIDRLVFPMPWGKYCWRNDGYSSDGHTSPARSVSSQL